MKTRSTSSPNSSRKPLDDRSSCSYCAEAALMQRTRLARGRNKHKEYRDHYMVTNTEVGLSAVLLWGLTKPTPTGKNSYAWPMVVDSSTGELAVWATTNGKWKPHLGWVQSEYAPAFAERCPKLPRVNAVSNQTGDTLQDLARGARPVKIQPAFASSSRNPLTAGMYYHFSPPAR